MYVITARNVNDAYLQGISLLRTHGRIEDSRAGRVVKADMPVTTLYRRPQERLLWEPCRDANPFFHLFESLWMLAGKNDVETLKYFVNRMSDFSDDGETFHGAYGFRWRNFFSEDQLPYVIDQLKNSPGTRRAVLQMWSAEADLIDPPNGAKDLPCNLMAKFEINSGALDMIVYNRSNDMILGAYGANVVHFSILQEYIANVVGIPVGRYWQVSGNFHAYESTIIEKRVGQEYDSMRNHHDYYADGEAIVYPKIAHDDNFLNEVVDLLEGRNKFQASNPFLADVAWPMLLAFYKWKAGEKHEAIHVIKSNMHAGLDWTRACLDWMNRRIKKDSK